MADNYVKRVIVGWCHGANGIAGQPRKASPSLVPRDTGIVDLAIGLVRRTEWKVQTAKVTGVVFAA